MSRFEQRVRRRVAEEGEYAAGFEEGIAEFNLAQELDRARQEGQLTKSELARRVGRQQAFVSRQLNHPQNLKLNTLALLLRGLGKRAELVISDAKPGQPTLQVVRRRRGRGSSRRPVAGGS
jgi:predicted transcriptional regulator